MSFNLKITKDTQGSSGVPIPAPIKLDSRTEIYKTGYEFPIGRLKAVKYVADKKVKRDGVEEHVPALEFLFKDKKDRQFTHIDFPLEVTDAKLDVKQSAMIQRIKHIWEQTVGEEPLEIEGEDFASFFESVAKAFNSVKVSVTKGEDTKEYVKYGQTPVYIKLVYYNSRLQMPMYPNFVQTAVKGGKQIPCETLMINPEQDQIEPKAKPRASAYNAGGEAGFASEGMDADLPDV